MMIFWGARIGDGIQVKLLSRDNVASDGLFSVKNLKNWKYHWPLGVIYLNYVVYEGSCIGVSRYKSRSRLYQLLSSAPPPPRLCSNNNNNNNRLPQWDSYLYFFIFFFYINLPIPLHPWFFFLSFSFCAKTFRFSSRFAYSIMCYYYVLAKHPLVLCRLTAAGCTWPVPLLYDNNKTKKKNRRHGYELEFVPNGVETKSWTTCCFRDDKRY